MLCKFVLCVLWVALLLSLLFIGELGIYTIIIVFSLIGSIIGIFLWLKNIVGTIKRERYLQANGTCIKAIIDKSALKIGGDNIQHICYLVAYYTEDEKTYIFEDSICMFETQFVLDVKKIKKQGKIPAQIDILVAPDDYSKYIVLKYKYLHELYQMNSDLVDYYI